MNKVSAIQAVGSGTIGAIAGLVSALLFLLAFIVVVPFAVVRAIIRTCISEPEIPARATIGL